MFEEDASEDRVAPVASRRCVLGVRRAPQHLHRARSPARRAVLIVDASDEQRVVAELSSNVTLFNAERYRNPDTESTNQ